MTGTLYMTSTNPPHEIVERMETTRQGVGTLYMISTSRR
jgi:hypothetical protein